MGEGRRESRLVDVTQLRARDTRRNEKHTRSGYEEHATEHASRGAGQTTSKIS